MDLGRAAKFGRAGTLDYKLVLSSVRQPSGLASDR